MSAPASGPPASLRAARDWAAAAIASASETPRLDAELLIAHALRTTRQRVLLDAADPSRQLPAESREPLRELVCRRVADREPLAYIVGRRHFRALELRVDRRALIPRPETELLVEEALSLPRGAAVLDLGTGSGAVALALRQERPDLAVAGSDVSAEALALAGENGRRLGLEVRWIHADLLDGVPDCFDALVSNPPYVALGEAAGLAPEILRHEPREALFGGPDGLATIAALLRQAAPRRRLRRILLEVGAGQAAAVASLMRDAGFAVVRASRDLAGIERVLVAERAR